MESIGLSSVSVIEGVTATRCFSPFFIISREAQKKKNWQFSNYVDFSCINEQDMFKNREFRRFCKDSTALSEKNLILAISFLQQGT